MKLREILYHAGGRQFLFGLYAVTLLLGVYVYLRHRDLVGAASWPDVVAAFRTIAIAFLGMKGVEEVARRAIAAKNGGSSVGGGGS